MSSVLHHHRDYTMKELIAELYIMTLEKTQHDLGMYNVTIHAYMSSLSKRSPHDVQTSVWYIVSNSVSVVIYYNYSVIIITFIYL